MLVQFAIFLTVCLTLYALSCGFLVVCNRRQIKPAEWIPVAPFGPYFASISTLFALFLAFHGASIWSNKAQAQRAYVDVGTAIKRLDGMLSPAQLDLSGPRSSLQRYVRYIFRDEWRKTRNTHASDRAEYARTRADRLWIGGNHTEAISWLAVFVLGLFTHLAIASIHLDKPRAGAVALGLLSCTTTIAYWSLAIVDDPYRLMDNLNPSAWLPTVT